MTSQQDKRAKVGNQQDNDRRIMQDAGYAGPERRKGDRRLHQRRSA